MDKKRKYKQRKKQRVREATQSLLLEGEKERVGFMERRCK